MHCAMEPMPVQNSKGRLNKNDCYTVPGQSEKHSCIPGKKVWMQFCNTNRMQSLRQGCPALRKHNTFHPPVKVLSTETTDTENETEVLNKFLQPSHKKNTWKPPKTL